jgi:hypothetical protein
MRRGGTLGEKWDTRWLRRVREYGWFRQHEGELIEEARRRKETASTGTRVGAGGETGLGRAAPGAGKAGER